MNAPTTFTSITYTCHSWLVQICSPLHRCITSHEPDAVGQDQDFLARTQPQGEGDARVVSRAAGTCIFEGKSSLVAAGARLTAFASPEGSGTRPNFSDFDGRITDDAEAVAPIAAPDKKLVQH